MSHVGLCGFARVMCRVEHMGMGAMGMMSRCLMMTRGVVYGGFLVMLRRMLMVLGGLHMMGMCRMGL